MDINVLINIWNDCKNKIPIKDIQRKYNISEDVVFKIKFCRGAYEFLKDHGCYSLQNQKKKL